MSHTPHEVKQAFRRVQEGHSGSGHPGRPTPARRDLRHGFGVQAFSGSAPRALFTAKWASRDRRRAPIWKEG